MKSRYIKRRKKFHYIIISVTIIVCLLGTVFTSLAILNSSRDLLIANAVNELNTKMDYIKNGIVTSALFEKYGKSGIKKHSPFTDGLL